MKKQNKALRKVDQPLFRYWQALYLSFFSRALYVDVGKRWTGFAIPYLLLLIFIVSIPFATRVSFDFNYYFDMDIVQPLKKIPKLYVQNGKVSLDKPMPFYIKNNKGQVISIVDTSGVIDKIDARYPALSTLITRDKIIYRLPKPHFFFEGNVSKEPGPIYIQPLTPDINQVVEGKELVASFGIERIRFLSILILYPTVAMIFFVLYLIFFLAFGLMGQLIANLFMKFSITYPQSCRLLIVSSTPQVLILMLFLTMNWIFYGFGITSTALLAIYFSFAVFSLKRESQKLVLH